MQTPIHGTCDAAFHAVRDAFQNNFIEHGEIGASVCVTVNGVTVVDLWGGFSNPQKSAVWQEDQLVNAFSIGKGVTAGFARPGTSQQSRAAAEALMRSVGDFVWLETEQQIDAVTAVSGSGPAYVFHLVECLAAAARSQGLPPDIADTLARRTIEGAGALLAASPQSPEALRRSVTSPGGTTEAALKVLMEGKRNETLLVEAVSAATRRASELARARGSK